MTITLSLPRPFCSSGSIITDMDVTFRNVPTEADITNAIVKGNSTLNITSVAGKLNKQYHQCNAIQNGLEGFIFLFIVIKL